MTFHWPYAFWLLLVPVALLLRDLLGRRALTVESHPKIAHGEASHSSLTLRRSSTTRNAGARRARRTVHLYLYLGLALATVAIARPQWGRVDEPVFDQSREILIALDLSRSMSAEDVKPSRLERSRLLVTSLLERLKGERVGLVVFSGTAFLQSPLSADYEILREFLPLLTPGYLPEGGTNYDALLDTTLDAFGTSGSADRFLIVLSDGEAQSDTWRKHVAALKTKGIRVLGLGIGTEEGAMIPDGDGGFIKDERGAVVLSKLDSTTLRELSEQTGGLYTNASSWVDLSQIIQDTVEKSRRGEFKDASTVRLVERFQWPLAAALLFFLLSFWREFPVRPKPRPLQLASAQLSALAVAVAFTVLSLLQPATAFAASSPAPVAVPMSAVPTAAAAPDAAPEPLSAPVTQLVSRLASRARPTATDYAELARATATYGERAATTKEPAPESVVRDGLAAVDAGEALDPKAADWSALREQLTRLLAKKDPPPPPQKQDEPKPDEPKPEQNKKNDPSQKDQSSEQSDSSSDSEKSDENSGQSQDQSKPGSPDSSADQKSGQGDPSSSDSKPQGEPSSQKSDKPAQSAFGDMNEPAPEPSGSAQESPADAPPSGESSGQSADMQQVGGVSTESPTDPARLDPNLAIPLQKLDQVKQGDSPARLFQLLQEPSQGAPAPKGRDW